MGDKVRVRGKQPRPPAKVPKIYVKWKRMWRCPDAGCWLKKPSFKECVIAH